MQRFVNEGLFEASWTPILHVKEDYDQITLVAGWKVCLAGLAWLCTWLLLKGGYFADPIEMTDCKASLISSFVQLQLECFHQLGSKYEGRIHTWFGLVRPM